MYFVFLAFFTQAGIHEKSEYDLLRLIPLALIFCGALWALFIKNPKISKMKLTEIDVMLILFVLFSFIPLLIDGLSGPFLYSLIFILIGYSLLFCLKAYGIERVLNLYLNANFLILLISLWSDYTGFIAALNVTRAESGLLRFMALGAHPNLVGHNFGLAFVISIYSFIYSVSKISKIKYLILGVSFFILPLAASSRGALVSMAGAMIFMFIYFLLHIKETKKAEIRIYKFMAAILTALMFFLVYEFNYLIDILELQTESRGLDSGLTGRGENWGKLIGLIASSPRILILGSGFRTWNDDVYGYATDSSYLNLMWEIGIPLALIAILLPIKKLYTSLTRGRDSFDLLVVMIFSFMLIEGFVARYLYAIGNPASCLFLGLLLIVSHPELRPALKR